MLTITLPLPPKCLHPNSRYHWRQTAKPRRDYRLFAKLAAYAAMEHMPAAPYWSAVDVQCTFTFKTNARRDRDNLLGWLKSGIDGIADAGVVENDSQMTHLPVIIAPKNPLQESLVITITPKENLPKD